MKASANESPELKIAVAAARAAGEILRTGFGQSHEIEFKGPIDIVTQVDRASENCIVEFLQKETPGCAFLTEESSRQSAGSDLWLIDPLDGSVNYVSGYPSICISIAFESAGVLELGVVYDPLRDELFTAQRGGGAKLNSRALSVSAKESLGFALMSTGFPYDAWTNDRDNTAESRYFVKHTLGLRSIGSAALSLAYVACGRFDGYWEHGLFPYDVAAGIVLVREAGGRATDFSGRDDAVYRSEIAAANPHLHREMLTQLRKHLTIEVNRGMANDVRP